MTREEVEDTKNRNNRQRRGEDLVRQIDRIDALTHAVESSRAEDVIREIALTLETGDRQIARQFLLALRNRRATDLANL